MLVPAIQDRDAELKVSAFSYGITLTEYSSLYGDYNGDSTSYTSIEHAE